jgi:hypothetical protein
MINSRDGVPDMSGYGASDLQQISVHLNNDQWAAIRGASYLLLREAMLKDGRSSV